MYFDTNLFYPGIDLLFFAILFSIPFCRKKRYRYKKSVSPTVAAVVIPNIIPLTTAVKCAIEVSKPKQIPEPQIATPQAQPKIDNPQAVYYYYNHNISSYS